MYKGKISNTSKIIFISTTKTLISILLSFETGLLGCFIFRSLTVNLTETGLLGYFIPSQSLSVSFAGSAVI